MIKTILLALLITLPAIAEESQPASQTQEVVTPERYRSKFFLGLSYQIPGMDSTTASAGGTQPTYYYLNDFKAQLENTIAITAEARLLLKQNLHFFLSFDHFKIKVTKSTMQGRTGITGEIDITGDNDSASLSALTAGFGGDNGKYSLGLGIGFSIIGDKKGGLDKVNGGLVLKGSAGMYLTDRLLLKADLLLGALNSERKDYPNGDYIDLDTITYSSLMLGLQYAF